MSIAAARFGCDRPKPLDERLEPDREELRLEPGADLGIGRQRLGRDPAGDGPQVQPGAADEDREPAPLPDPGERRAGVGREVGDGERLVGSTRSRPWCGMPRRSVDRRLRRPDVEAAVDLSRVGRDDLGGDPLPRQARRDVDREPGLAGRRRAGDDEQRRASCSRGARNAAIVERTSSGCSR